MMGSPFTPEQRAQQNRSARAYQASAKGKAAKKAWLERNAEHEKGWRAAYESRPEVKARMREQNRVRASSPQAKIRRAAYAREWRKNPKNRLSHRMSVALRRGLFDGKAGQGWETMAGYSLGQLRAHLERQFIRGMGWANIDLWHIDHIIPLASFQYNSPTDTDFRAAWALTNLRPMWARDNQAKSSARQSLL